MGLVSVWRVGSELERVWAVPVLLAAAAACITATSLVLVVPLLVVALAPWALGVCGQMLPPWLFATAGMLPVVGVAVLQGLNGALFLATTSLCLLASWAVGSGQIVLLAGVAAALPFMSYLHGPPYDPGAIYFAIGNLFGLVVGRLLGRTRQLGEELRAADARLAAVRVQEERTRLARDVHDLVAHSLTVVVLHLGGARRVLRSEPDMAEAALEQAERVGRESLDGIREVVGLLRTDDDGRGISMDIAQLVETYRAASVPIDFDDADTEQLPLLVRGTLYRVAQEALANAARYRAGQSTVRVHVRVHSGGVELSVSNAGAAGRRSMPGGFGLAGLREQVAAIGGTLHSGPVGDGWLVECRLPRDATAIRFEHSAQ